MKKSLFRPRDNGGGGVTRVGSYGALSLFFGGSGSAPPSRSDSFEMEGSPLPEERRRLLGRNARREAREGQSSAPSDNGYDAASTPVVFIDRTGRPVPQKSQSVGRISNGSETKPSSDYSRSGSDGSDGIRLSPGMTQHPIRFQVVIWYIGPVDVVLGRVTMKFRITIFWNLPSDAEHLAMGKLGYGSYNPKSNKVWTMHGRQRAFERELHEITPGTRLVYVPPVSILNAVDFETIGDPEVCLVDSATNLMKWSCMYMASLIQEGMTVTNFPHDEHDLVLKLGILRHRQPGRRWDKDRWTLGLATEDDSQRSTRVPHGLIVDHVRIPEFTYESPRTKGGPSRLWGCHQRHPKDDDETLHDGRHDGPHGLRFDFVPLSVGQIHRPDQCLQIGLRCRRVSSYYDSNIIPLLAVLNLVGMSTLELDATEFGNRGQIVVAAAFVEIGIRMTVDSKLPNVGYQIKLQRTLNLFFFGLLFLVLESSVVYACRVKHNFSERFTDVVDWIVMGGMMLYTCLLLVFYYFVNCSRSSWSFGAARW